MADASQLVPTDETFTVAASTKLTYADYTVGWICALSCELAAALAVLDERHDILTNLPGDTNIYNYGKISGHNVVISSLPNGVYGTTEATAVAIRMLNAFRSITIPLMVGVGGGVPSSKNDIRLADLVVSVPTPDCPAVIQYDYGKTVESGTFERKGHLNKPCLQLLTAVANVRADGLSTRTKIPLIIEDVLSGSLGREYDYPTDNDILYEPGCEHVSELSKCQKCGPRKPITRPSRLVDLDTKYKPKSAALHRPPLMAHYGPIASANQVMKNGRIRDQIAKPLGILCFEMEAAGLMDHFPCLVIRGVSDYCDARKMKTFQNYAAVVAAAYAKHLLSKVPLQDQEQVQAAKDHFNAVGLGHRLMAIRNPHPNTCSWLFQHPVYEDWLKDSHFMRHHGFLWIKGKPGAGKSTLMKFIRKHFDSQSAISQISLISFFFNARGSDLEKSTVGMWRSLLSQLLNAMPSLQMSIDWSCLPAARQEWSLESMQRLFVTMVEQLGHQPLLCLIDALDESPEDDIRTMVGVFEEIGRLNSSGASRVRVLWSSRYYPHISIRYGNEIRLDETIGHSQDLKHYIDTELGAEENELLDDIKAQIFIKSRGIFLWIVLVISILRKEYDHGRIIAMQKKLKVLPEKLTDLFREIVLRDMDNLDEFLLCIQWVLYSLRPLDGIEFYTAMASRLDEDESLDRPSKATSSFVIPRYVTSSSKGLAELNHQFSSQARVQFIHESVREFLMQDGSMQDVWSGFNALSPGSSHEQLKVCCIRLLAHVQSAVRTSLSFEEIVEEWPFAAYAVSNMLVHAEEACRSGYSQVSLLNQKVFTYWYDIRLQRGLCPTNFYPTTPDGRLLCCLACDNLPILLGTQLSRTLSSNAREHFTLPLYCAMKHQSVDAIRVLLLPATEIPDLLIDDLCESFRRKPPMGSESFLSWFRRLGKKELGRHLLRCDEWVYRHGRTEILNLAAAHGQGTEALQLLLRQQRVFSSRELQSPMQIAAGAGNVEMLQLFTNLGAVADPPFMEPEELTPLMAAVRNGASDSIPFLLSQGASIDRIVSTEWGPRMAMHYAVERGDLKVLNILLQAGASFTATEFDMEEPHDLAVKCGHKSIVKRLEAAARGELVDTRPGNAVYDIQRQPKREGRVFSSVEDWNVTSSNTENEVTSPTADSRRVSLEEQAESENEVTSPTADSRRVSLEEQAESAPSLKPVRKDQRLSIFSLWQSKGETSDSKHGKLQRFSKLFSGRQRKE